MANAMLDARKAIVSKWNKIEYRRFSFITGNWRRQHSALIQISMSSSR